VGGLQRYCEHGGEHNIPTAPSVNKILAVQLLQIIFKRI